MPSDSNGVYTLPDGYLAVTGEPILASQHNPPLEDLASSMTQRLMRSGAAPMTGPLKSADGTVSAPGLTMGSAPSSGWYKTSAGWGFSIGGVKVAELTSDGLSTGARFVGELIPYTRSTAPARTVFPYGQTLDRTTFADLWVVAQVEIAAGNTFYNNGNGTTTFGIGDMRGRSVAGKDDMGGSGAFRLTSTYFGTNPQIIGATGGAESLALSLAQLPTGITSTGTATGISASGNRVPVANATEVDLSFTPGGSGTHVPAASGWSFSNSLSGSASVTSSNTSGAAHRTVQPTMICNYLLYAGA